MNVKTDAMDRAIADYHKTRLVLPADNGRFMPEMSRCNARNGRKRVLDLKGKDMKVVVAMDSFKGCLSSAEANGAVVEGITKAFPDAEIIPSIVLPYVLS